MKLPGGPIPDLCFTGHWSVLASDLVIYLGEIAMFQSDYPLVRWFFLACLTFTLLVVGYDLANYPAVVTTARSEAGIYLVLFALAIYIYGWFALYQTRAQVSAGNRHIALRYGIILGLFCGGAWIFEILVANVWGPGLGSLNVVFYFGSTLIGAFLPGLAGLLAGWRTRLVASGLQAGLLTGMCGGLILFLTVTAPLSMLLVDAGQRDPQSINEFQRSGLPDIQTFLVGDYLAAMIAHLWIGLITGLFLGTIGGALGKALAPLQSNTAQSRGGSRA